MLSLDLLRTFEAVVRLGTVTDAARELGIAQPTASQHLARLEELTRTPLFHRRPRGLAPTAEGQVLARRLAEPLDSLHRVTSTWEATPTGGRPDTLALGAPADFAAEVLPSALGRLLERGIRARMALGSADQLLRELGDGRLDLVISTVRPRLRGVVSAPLVDEEFVLVVAPGLLDSGRLPAPLGSVSELLDGVPLLAYAADLPMMRRWWRHVLGRRVDSVEAALVVPDLRLIRDACLQGAGATVLPRYLCHRELAAGTLVPVAVPADAPINTLYLAARRADRDRRSVALAWDAIVEVSGELASHVG
ncbi:MAG: LysR family transcriptional regulator [Nocardioides sp.]